MENFTYYTPTKVVFGKETEKQTGDLVKVQKSSCSLWKRKREADRAPGPDICFS